MHRYVRFALGVLLGEGALTAYLWYVGPAAVLGRASTVAGWAVAVVALPQAASVVPIPGSLGAYDLLLAGALVAMTGAPAASAAAAVLIVRTFGLGVSLAGGGVAVAFLRARRS